ncbi:type VI secretion system baseplate subunit TssG [Pseudomonas sp. KNUC1026]|uniref:type VI secretion system baseplate subunit TssG n=1 Tax=Pseudomonas sp. KNUC1026 TaxID=2893890 RepID=UPI0022A6AFCA|nr:type VI secretion system baseplate subunit TssG [Pseudomonas sp. KNUC1026]
MSDYWSPRLAALHRARHAEPAWHRAVAGRRQAPLRRPPGGADRYPDGLRAILSEYLGVPVQLEEFIGQWLPLPEHSQLGRCQLGVDTCLGSHVWDRQHKFRMRLGPLTLAQYHHLLPGAAAWNDVAAWVREYQGLELDWELNLVLGHAHIPALPLDGSGRLGFDSWLGKPVGDAADLLLSHHYANDFKERDRTHE